YPSEKEEGEILERWKNGFDSRRFESISITPIDSSWLGAARQEIETVTVEPTLYKYLVTLVRRTRDWPALTLGASPRAAIGLFFVARALAGIEGRDFLIPDDIKAAAPAVLRHRILLKPEADLEGLTADQVVADLLAAVEVPK
ncbi:MAG TPA: MoxR family ATPase, partial [Candidatus Acidoferrales bacterium]|nr:MoxR family ATPase [Candidatus Acidoferrales bacterium]